MKIQKAGAPARFPDKATDFSHPVRDSPVLGVPAMIPRSWKSGWRLLFLVAVLAVILWFGYVAFLFDQGMKQSEQQGFPYSLDFSCN
ncbi:MAG: hypothetical protein CW742_14015, partial [Methanoregula sp.]